MRASSSRLGRVLRNHLFADAIVVKGAQDSARSHDNPELADHLEKAQRLIAALSRTRETQRQQRTPTTVCSSSVVVGGSDATAKVPLMDIINSVGKSTVLMVQGASSAFLQEAEVEEEVRGVTDRRSHWARQKQSFPFSSRHPTVTAASGTAHASGGTEACPAHAAERSEEHDDDDIAFGTDGMPLLVGDVLAATEQMWTNVPAMARLEWVLETPLGRKLVRAQLRAAAAQDVDAAQPEKVPRTLAEQMMARYDGLGLRARGGGGNGCAPRRPRPTVFPHDRPEFVARTASLDGLYPSRSSTGSTTRVDYYTTLRRLFADRIIDASALRAGDAAHVGSLRPRSVTSASSLSRPTLAGCTPPDPNTAFVGKKVQVALSNQRKSLWKQQVKKMIGGDGASTFMGALKSLQQPAGECPRVHSSPPLTSRRASATAATTESSAERRVASRLSRDLSASETAAGVSTTTNNTSAGIPNAAASVGALSDEPPLLFTENFLALCAEMGIGSPRYAYVSRGLLRQLYPNTSLGSATVAMSGSETAPGTNTPWHIAYVRAEAEKLSRDYDAHVAQLEQGRDPQEAAEARRRYDASLLEEELRAVHTQLMEFRGQMPTLRRLADVMSN